MSITTQNQSNIPIPIGLLTVVKVLHDSQNKELFVVRNNENGSQIPLTEAEITILSRDKKLFDKN